MQGSVGGQARRLRLQVCRFPHRHTGERASLPIRPIVYTSQPEMRKRLRKKRGRGEFAGYAFGVSYVLDDVSSPRANEFLDRFVEQAIEPLGLECRATPDRRWDFRVACVDGGKPTSAQRSAVRGWLTGRKEVARFEVEEQG